MTKLFQLKLPDWIKGIIMAATVSVAGYVLTVVQTGSFAVSLHQIAIFAVAGALGYLLKQLGTSQTITTTQPPSPPVTITEKTFGINTSPSAEPIVPVPTPPASDQVG